MTEGEAPTKKPNRIKRIARTFLSRAFSSLIPRNKTLVSCLGTITIKEEKEKRQVESLTVLNQVRGFYNGDKKVLIMGETNFDLTYRLIRARRTAQNLISTTQYQEGTTEGRITKGIRTNLKRIRESAKKEWEEGMKRKKEGHCRVYKPAYFHGCGHTREGSPNS